MMRENISHAARLDGRLTRIENMRRNLRDGGEAELKIKGRLTNHSDYELPLHPDNASQILDALEAEIIEALKAIGVEGGSDRTAPDAERK